MSLREPLLFAASCAFMALPFLPAIREALRPSDEEALPISRFQLLDPRGGTRQVAWRYCSMFGLDDPEALRAFLADTADTGEGALPDGVLRLARGGSVPAGFAGTDLVSGGAIAVPAGERIGARLYALEGVELGPGAEALEAHSERELRLLGGAKLAWWGSGARARLESGSFAQGGLVARDEIRVGGGARFGLLRAPLIRCDGAAAASNAPLPEGPGREGAHRRQVVDRDLRVEAGARVDGDLIVRGSVTVGAGAQVSGSIKARGSIVLEAGAAVRGSVVAGDRVALGEGARVGGCVLGELETRLGARSVVGRPGHLASVSSQRVYVSPGALVHGMIRAWKEGYATQA
jgi:hypothetical protein